MLRGLFPVRRSEWRDAMTAFAFLFVFVTGHSILEATRDALFLAKIPTTRLPWVYVALAVTALFATRAQSVFARATPRRVLVGWALVASLGTLGICLGLRRMGEVGLYVLYIWSGVISTIVLIHFWSLVGGLFSIRQAKRLYGMIGLGAGVGAIVGSALVGASSRISAGWFAFVAAGLFFVAALLPMGFTSNGQAKVREADVAEPRVPMRVRAKQVVRQPYVRRVVLVSVLVTIAVTASDFLFKSQIAANVPAHELAETFGRVNVGLNAVSVTIQLFAVRPLLVRLPLPWVFAILPFGLALGGVGMAVAGSLGPALATKTIDGSLRFSVHRTAAELLLVPLAEASRTVAKSFVDVVGQRGGQMLGSLLILACVGLELPARWIAILLSTAAILATLGAIRLRYDYVQLFKDALASSRRRLTNAYAHLDMASIESLLASLDSDSEGEVLTALSILEREGKASVIPGLILYHPSEAVVVAALRIFGRRGHRLALHAIAHLEQSKSIRIRAEAMAARAVLAPDTAALAEQLVGERSAEVRSAIIATMAAFSMMPATETRDALDEIIERGSVESRVVLAEVIGWRRARVFEPQILRLAQAPELEVRRAAIAALGAMPTASASRALVDSLVDVQIAGDAQRALIAAGELGAAAVEEALHDKDRPRAVRRLLPHVVAEIDPLRGAVALLENLASETDGMVRYRSILALGHIVTAHPEVRLDARLVDAEIQRTVARAYRYIDRRLALVRGAEEDPSRATTGHELLVDLLRDKERNTVGRVFRLLALANPDEDFETIYGSIETGQQDHRSNAMELIHNVLRDPLRDAIIGLVDDIADSDRLPRGERFHEPLELDYEGALAQLLGSSSSVVRDFAAYHAGELHSVAQRNRIQRLSDEGRATSDIRRTLKLLASPEDASTEGLTHAG